MPPPGAPGDKPKNFKGTLVRLIKALAEYRLHIILIIIFAVGSCVFSVVGPKILGNATSELYAGVVSKLAGGSGIDFAALHRILIFLFSLYVFSALLSFFQSFLLAGITQKVAYSFRRQLSEKVNRLPMSFFDKQQTCEVLSLITNDVDTLTNGLAQSLTQLITSVITIIGVFFMMLSINIPMTAVTVLMVPISAYLVSVIVKHSQKYFMRQQAFLGHVNGQIEESFSGVSVIQVFNNEEAVIRDFEKQNNGLYQSAWRSGFLSGLMMPITGFIGNICYVAVAVLGGWYAAMGTIRVGDIQSFIQYSRSFRMPINDMTMISNMLQSMVAAAERIFRFLDEPEEEQLAAEHCMQNGVRVDPHSLQGAVEFRNVRFGYDPEQPVIKNFSAKIAPGQKIAIVGPTGAGKTTIVKLLMRFYDVNDGAIFVDGHNITSFDRSELREVFGMVLQDTWLFAGSITENIRYGRLDASDEEIRQAAEAAHVHHFVQTLPEGYNMQLNEDATNISQGQKQLLTIARAILADNRILILDEATSSVDTRTEELIQKAMDNLMQGRTSFIIAHRLSTIRDADLVLVMNEGDIVEQGTHDELLQKNGVYAQMYYSQFDTVA
ncbi:MAG: ABC transporter ATP-binding protein [Firmicutes bacterium]|nr:ABC transporter ATP-binding protein [Bacillota bacterium]